MYGRSLARWDPTDLLEEIYAEDVLNRTARVELWCMFETAGLPRQDSNSWIFPSTVLEVS